MPKQQGLWTVHEVAEYLGWHIKTVYRKAATGDIPSVKLPGGDVRFQPEDILRLPRARARTNEVPA